MMPKNSANGTLGAALKLYDEQGWFVLPTDPGAKKPCYGFTYKDRYGDRLPSREEVAAWPEWSAKSVRLGARTGAVSGIIVLDVDSQEAHEFVKSQGHPIGPMVQSPREGAGLHLYFKHPGFYVKSTVEVGGVEGLDVRGDYGIVVLPPSIDHKVGRSYEWIIPPEDVAVPEAPVWLIELLKKQASSKERLDVPKIMAGVPEGQRDSALNRLAGKFRHMNLPEDIAVPMIELAAERCSPPFNKAEARAKVKWAYTHYAAGDDDARFLFSDPYSRENGKSKDSDPISLGSIEKPGPREWLVQGLIPMKYPTTLYGTGGVSKSFLALSLGMTIAAQREEWMGFRVTGGPVLYLDFELEVEEQARRAYEVAAGMKLERPPKDLFYQSAGGQKMTMVFEKALKWCRENDAKLLIVDSTGLALEGDSESAKDVIAFFREVVGAFMNAGVCVLLIDHQSKMQSGDSYQKKSAFGSGYKEYLARSAVQVELVNRNDGEINVRFRQKKTNFGSLIDPFEVNVSFGLDEVRVEKTTLDDGEMASEESLGAEERVLRAVRHLGTATPVEVVELTGLALATVRKQFSLLKKRELLLENGESRDGAKVCVESRQTLGFPFSHTIGKENGKPAPSTIYARVDNLLENTENLENSENQREEQEIEWLD